MKTHTYPFITSDEERRRIQHQNEIDRIYRPHYDPAAFLSLERPTEAARLILLGLQHYYFECLAAGKLDVWKKAAHSAVELLASVPDVKIIRRQELEAVLESETRPYLQKPGTGSESAT